MRPLVVILAAGCLLSCGTPPPLDEATVSAYRQLQAARVDQFRSAAYLIDLRVDDAGTKFSVSTELYFSGDSVGFYGRGYFGRGAFKGNIIDGQITVFFDSRNEYFAMSEEQLRAGADCAEPGEVLLYMMSLFSGRHRAGDDLVLVSAAKRKAQYSEGRYEGTVTLAGNQREYPMREILVNSPCGDSITFAYSSFRAKFPFYQITEGRYDNAAWDFHVRGFVREQRYNTEITPKKFVLDIPADAVRVEKLGN
ncbi:MAG: hypothetical protein PHR28_07480 [candidate division Zixibacteria bacterium]|nr:hypothetical protein [candidate division Zixibacteria bacterium]